MNMLLIALATMTSVNPARLHASLPGQATDRRGAVASSACVVLIAVVVVLAGFSGPLLESVGVTPSSGIIAAGVALVVIGARDSVVAPPVVDQPSAWPWNIATPVFFPTMFTPALALLAVAAGADRGVIGGVAACVGVLASIAAALLIGRSARFARGWGLRATASVLGLLAVVAGALVATRGVMSV